MTPGLYIHIPFCKAKCNYCHFTSMRFDRAAEERYVKAVLEEIRCLNTPSLNGEADTVYFGGGTPGLIPAGHISDILQECRQRFRILEKCEICLEVNPDTVSADKASVYRDSGVNRISVGAQSFEEQELKSIGRLHTSDAILESVDQLRRIGFVNINLDLILGLPSQTAKSWHKNLDMAAGLSIPHISVYMLDLDEPCGLRSLLEKGAVSVPEEDLVSDLYLETIELLSSHGYVQYEISNFAHPGFACRHNLKYWRREPVLGFGLASHSFDGQARYANYSRMDDYIKAVESGRSPVNWRKKITDIQALEESLFLGLRLTEGVNWDRLCNTHRSEALAGYEKPLNELCDRGFMERTDSVFRLTPSGMLVSNEIFQMFV